MNHPDALPEPVSPDWSRLLRACLYRALGIATGSFLFFAVANGCLGKLL
jgi:hypothetical protein